MDQYGVTMPVGDATLTLFNVGDLLFDMSAELAIPPSEWRPSDHAVFAKPIMIPVQCVLVQTPETTILVDAGAYDVETEPEMRNPEYAPPPSLPQQLSASGIAPERIEHLVITHAHFDHFNGLTQRDATGDLEPVYPNATVYLGRADWDEMQRAVASSGSLEARTLGLLHDRGLLSLVTDATRIAPGVEIAPTPGETPGHVALRVESGGAVAYCLGDLYHHVVEVEMPEWAVTWADHTAIRASRSRIVASALDEDAVVTATHIGGFGRLVSTADGLRWEAV